MKDPAPHGRNPQRGQSNEKQGDAPLGIEHDGGRRGNVRRPVEGYPGSDIGLHWSGRAGLSPLGLGFPFGEGHGFPPRGNYHAHPGVAKRELWDDCRSPR